MRIFVFVFATANLILDLLWCGVKLETLILKDSPQNHMSLIVSYGLMAFVYCVQDCCVPTAMINMIGNLLKFYSNEVAALTSTKQKIFQERYHASAK